MSHLEDLISEYYEWQGYLVRRNIKVGRLKHGGWAGELDVVAYHPETQALVHLEPSIDAHSWTKREERFKKKFDAGRSHIFKAVFPWLDRKTPLRQVAVLISHPPGRDRIGGGEIVSVDELVGEIRSVVASQGVMGRSAVPERFPNLRTIQLVERGYYRQVDTNVT